MSGSMWRNPMVLGVLALGAAILFFNTFAIVPETRQAVILRLEQPTGRTINPWRPGQEFGQTGAGLIAKIPFFERIVWVDKRVRDIDLDNQSVLSTDQQRLQVDAFARYRIVDPLRMIVTAGSESGVESRLQPILRASLRNELGKRPFAALLSPERGQVMHNIQAGLQTIATQYGVQIVDVRIKQAELPDGSPLDSALERMRQARNQEAANITAQGQKLAQIIRAEADAQAAQIYAASFNKDPEFYDFYRAMQSYRTTFVGGQGQQAGETSIILSPQDGYLRQFESKGK